VRRSHAVTLFLSAAVVVAFVSPAAATATTTSGARTTARASSSSIGFDDPLCVSCSSLCADAYDNPGSAYVGHDEPSLLFKSGVRGSGNDLTYTLTLPKDPATQPTAGGPGATWNFQLRPTFWFGLTLCDTESAPEFTKTCTPDSDVNDLTGTNPHKTNYIGKHPGNAFMELQFYGPGFVPQFEGFGCDATHYCAAMTIDSRTLNQNNGVENTADCNNYVLGGPEPINWAYVTKSGTSQAPANPFFTGTLSAPNFSAVNPNYVKDLLMSPGDRIVIHMHDTAAGFRTDLSDLTTGQHGSMTASVANGFGHILYTPKSSTCKEAPYAFHPEYATANPRGNTWSAHTYNVAFSDEIGHFENCLKLDSQFNCVKPGSFDGSKPDPDDGNSFCVPAADSSLVKINGCFSADSDFDAQSYRHDWPGTLPNPVKDMAVHPTSVLFTSPKTRNGTVNLSTVQFEADLPRIEASDSQDNPPFCDTHTGSHCVNPPMGAQFYPFYSTGISLGTCVWQEGGNFIPGTVNSFGGSSTAEYGPLLATVYPSAGPTTVIRYDNFNSGSMPNPCMG
jgi:hypothetical protein